MPDSRANARARRPAANATDRRTGTGFAGWAALTRRTAHHHQIAATAMPRAGSGSNVQPNSSEAADGASTGTGPWAATEVGLAIASAPRTPAPTSEPTSRRGMGCVAIDGILARTTLTSRARRRRSGYHGAGPTLGRFGRDLLDGGALGTVLADACAEDL